MRDAAIIITAIRSQHSFSVLEFLSLMLDLIAARRCVGQLLYPSFHHPLGWSKRLCEGRRHTTDAPAIGRRHMVTIKVMEYLFLLETLQRPESKWCLLIICNNSFNKDFVAIAEQQR
jgi:hypothetical protein